MGVEEEERAGLSVKWVWRAGLQQRDTHLIYIETGTVSWSTVRDWDCELVYSQRLGL